jgi:hypothetical protein
VGELRTNTWAHVPDGCRVRSSVQDGNATFEFESGADLFGFSMERSTIARLVELGTDALQRIDVEQAAHCGAPAAPTG